MSDLRIVHFSTADNSGGSGRAAYRIHAAMLARGHESHMITGQKVTHDRRVDTTYGNTRGRIADRVSNELMQYLSVQYYWYPSSHRVLNHEWVKAANVYQLYNTHGGYFSQKWIPRLSDRAPLVWRLSDMWPMTGHCAYAGACDKWEYGCHQCPDLGSYPPLKSDTTRFHWRLKDKLYSKSNITIVAPSSWIEEAARKSPLLGRFRIARIPNGLDLHTFKPVRKNLAREILGIDPGKKIVMFCAQELDNNHRKGSESFLEMMSAFTDRNDVGVLAVGLGGDDWEHRLGMPVFRPGYLTDDRMLALSYAAADVLAAPSSVDNLPNHVLEALACGTPAVAFNSGGIADAVIDMETGFLIDNNDTAGFSRALQRILDDDELHTRLSSNGLELIRKEFNADVQAERFEKLYLELVNEHQGSRH